MHVRRDVCRRRKACLRRHGLTGRVIPTPVSQGCRAPKGEQPVEDVVPGGPAAPRGRGRLGVGPASDDDPAAGARPSCGSSRPLRLLREGLAQDPRLVRWAPESLAAFDHPQPKSALPSVGEIRALFGSSSALGRPLRLLAHGRRQVTAARRIPAPTTRTSLALLIENVGKFRVRVRGCRALGVVRVVESSTTRRVLAVGGAASEALRQVEWHGH